MVILSLYELKITMQQPEGFIQKGKENLVWRLTKSLYGLKQAPRQWYQKFECFMADQGYHKTQAYHCVFTKKFDEGERDRIKIEMLKKALSKSLFVKRIACRTFKGRTRLQSDSNRIQSKV